MDLSMLLGEVFFIVLILFEFIMGIASLIIIPAIITGIVYVYLGKRMNKKKKNKIVSWIFVALIILELILAFIFRNYFLYY